MATDPNLLLNPDGTPTYTPTPVPPPATSPQGGLLGQTVGTVQNPLPPIDPNVYENDNVASNLNALTSQDSDYMKLARNAGFQTANKRGLLNSSIASGASQASAIAAAAPLATTQAQIAAQRNLERVQSYFAGQRQQADITSRERMLQSQLTNEQLLQTRDIAAKLQMQGIDINNQQQMQQAQLAATKELTQMNIQAESDRLGRQLTAQEEAQIRDISAAQARLAMQITSSEKISSAELANQMGIAQLDAQTRTQLLEMANTSEEQRAALQYYLGEDQIYAQGVSALWQNADLPAPARNDAINQFTTLKNTGVDLPAALFGIDLSWGTTGTNPLALPPPTPTTQGSYPSTGTGSTTASPTGTLPTADEIAAMQNNGIPGDYAYYSYLASQQ